MYLFIIWKNEEEKEESVQELTIKACLCLFVGGKRYVELS